MQFRTQYLYQMRRFTEFLPMNLTIPWCIFMIVCLCAENIFTFTFGTAYFHSFSVWSMHVKRSSFGNSFPFGFWKQIKIEGLHWAFWAFCVSLRGVYSKRMKFKKIIKDDLKNHSMLFQVCLWLIPFLFVKGG